jgi:dephospho-CoA kinase
MILFGLTGGIASGKSTVAARFRERGVPVIDADQVARDVVAPGTDGLAAVRDAFGDGVLDDAGALDRKKLAAIAFADEPSRKKLNAILHPRIAMRTAELSMALAAEGHPVACYEAALLVENGVADSFRPLVVVAAPEALQIERAIARDRMTPAEAEARVRAQLPLAEKKKVADHVIDNDGDRDRLVARADEVLDAIRSRVKAPDR